MLLVATWLQGTLVCQSLSHFNWLRLKHLKNYSADCHKINYEQTSVVNLNSNGGQSYTSGNSNYEMIKKKKSQILYGQPEIIGLLWLVRSVKKPQKPLAGNNFWLMPGLFCFRFVAGLELIPAVSGQNVRYTWTAHWQGCVFVQNYKVFILIFSSILQGQD